MVVAKRRSAAMNRYHVIAAFPAGNASLAILTGGICARPSDMKNVFGVQKKECSPQRSLRLHQTIALVRRRLLH
jgi:hypothetical protein